ncbi:TonB family protein [Undibacterium parvum]|uniref:TonB family protein n=1 Tax=Undibacterium parvum TaxID=401471 RepID=A0A3Q9BP62_9BURK|nr:TonB family protein [Undibacterium parvum]AZP11359.1 TonB family protein [Undibacterium parvum]
MRFTTGSTPAVTKDIANRRLFIGVLLSLLCHALLLSLQFGIPGLGLPGLATPWSERRLDLPPPDLPIQLALPAPQPEEAVAAAPPILAAPKPEQISGMQLMAMPLPVVPAPAVSKAVQKPKKQKKNKTVEQISALALPVLPLPVLPTPAAARDAVETPVRVIAQDQKTEDSFVVPAASPEEPEHKASDSKIAKQKEEAILALVEEKNAELEAQAAQAQLAELALNREKEANLKQALIDAEAQALRDAQAQQLALKSAQLMQQKAQQKAEQKAEALKQQQEAVVAEQSLQKKKIAKKQEDDARQLAQENAEKVAQKNAQNAAALAAQKQEQLMQRKHQEAQAKEHQLTLDLEAKKALEEQLKQQQIQQQIQQAQLRQQQQELKTQKQAEQKLAEQKLAEQKLAEQKLAEQKLAEQKLAEQKLAEQKLAEQKLVEQRGRERALNDAAVAAAGKAASQAKANDDAFGGPGKLDGVARAKDIFSSELASRAREQLRGMDVLRGTPPVPRSQQDDRRRSLFGSIEREIPLRMYVDGWRQKVERNGNLNYSQTAKDKARGDPVVVVALRSDGSVEDVTIIRSSGRADLDEAVKRIVRVNAPYAAFPPNIAAKYDVIEIRRIWNFDETLKILEELR